jgi:transketolase N-terminal domain/subunit
MAIFILRQAGWPPYLELETGQCQERRECLKREKKMLGMTLTTGHLGQVFSLQKGVHYQEKIRSDHSRREV